MSHLKQKDAGFTLVEILCVLVLIGLVSSLVIFNMPAKNSEVKLQAETLLRELNALSQQSLISGEVRAFGLSETDYALYRYDGIEFISLKTQPWHQDISLRFTREGQRIELDETLTPAIIFEPTSINTPFALDMLSFDEGFEISSDGKGRVVLVKTQ